MLYCQNENHVVKKPVLKIKIYQQIRNIRVQFILKFIPWLTQCFIKQSKKCKHIYKQYLNKINEIMLYTNFSNFVCFPCHHLNKSGTILFPSLLDYCCYTAIFPKDIITGKSSLRQRQ